VTLSLTNLVRGESQVDLDGLWNQGREGEPRQKGDKEPNYCEPGLVSHWSRGETQRGRGRTPGEVEVARDLGGKREDRERVALAVQVVDHGLGP
jgi:hypothetical protein